MPGILRGYWEDDGTFVYSWPARFGWFLAGLVPRRMRHWPVLRRWYWQQDEVDEIRRRAQERAAAIQRFVE
jgi:hypothetical protein